MRPKASRLLGAAAGAALAVAIPGAAVAQQAPPVAPPLEIGAQAPDFAMPGATRFGLLAQPVRLSDYQGEVVVLAFFFRARSKG
jgi:hypothetical protein